MNPKFSKRFLVIPAIITALLLSIVAVSAASVPTPKADPAFRIQKVHNPTVYKTKTGNKYHRAGCKYLRHGKIKIKLSTAKKLHLKPCKVCHPPTR